MSGDRTAALDQPVEAPGSVRLWQWLAIGISAALGAATIIFFKAIYFTPDGYIYLQYARNIATGQGWSFNPGETSFATTSPTWTLVLALAATLARSTTALIWTSAFLGLAFYLLAAREFARLAAGFGAHRVMTTAATFLFAACPFLGVYQSISAMETGLCLFLGLLLTRTAFEGRLHPAVQGLGEGVFLVTRPEYAIAVVLLLVFFPRAGAEGRAPRAALAIRVCMIGVAAAPWFFFVYAHTGGLIPTSGNGRLLGYLTTVYPDLTVPQYLASSLAARIALIPIALRTQFLHHPIMMATVAGPFAVMTACLPAIVRLRSDRRNLLLLGWLFSTLSLLLYLIRQPLMYQRYFILFFPFALLTILGCLGSRRVSWGPALAVGLSVAIVLTTQYLGVRKYYPAAATGEVQLIADLARLDGVPDCRLAAEALGQAGLFTHCYVIDLGGLIDPPIWKYWAAGHRSIEYARDQHATHYIGETGGPVPLSTALLSRGL